MASREGLDIIVPMYNASAFIETCVASLIANNHGNIHVIVVDDGSTDDCADLIATNYQSHERVHLIRRENGGGASARNQGRAQSTASHIAFVDADDFVDYALFPVLHDFAKQTGCNVVQSGYDLYDLSKPTHFEDMIEGERLKNRTPGMFQNHEYWQADARYFVPLRNSIWRRVYRRDFLDQHDIDFPEQVRVSHDRYFQQLTLQYAGQMATFPNLRYHYRQHANQIVNMTGEINLQRIDTMWMVLKRAETEGWDSFAHVTYALINSANWSLAIIREDLRPIYAEKTAEVFAKIQQIFGDQGLQDNMIDMVRYDDFRPLFERKLAGADN